MDSGVPRLLFPFDDDASLAGHIRRVYFELGLRRIFERLGRDAVVKRFSPEPVCRKLSKIYGEVLARRFDTPLNELKYPGKESVSRGKA